MVLADTSVWIEHFRRGHQNLTKLLIEGAVLMHPCVAGELGCGNLKDRDAILSDLHALSMASIATDPEVLQLIENRRLWGKGLGWVDAQLLASALISNCRLWTLDKRLAAIASELKLS